MNLFSTLGHPIRLNYQPLVTVIFSQNKSIPINQPTILFISFQQKMILFIFQNNQHLSYLYYKERVLLVVNRPPFVVLPKIHQGTAKNTLEQLQQPL
jgi:hypothetical protein